MRPCMESKKPRETIIDVVISSSCTPNLTCNEMQYFNVVIDDSFQSFQVPKREYMYDCETLVAGLPNIYCSWRLYHSN